MIHAALYAGRLVVGVCLSVAGVSKLLVPLHDDDETILIAVLRRRRMSGGRAVRIARRWWRGLALIDVSLGALAISGLAAEPVGIACVIYMLAALGYLEASRRSAGSAPTCNCFGMAAQVGGLAMVRAGLLALAAAGYAVEAGSNPSATQSATVQAVATALWFVAVGALSPELQLVLSRGWRGMKRHGASPMKLSVWARGIAEELEATVFWRDVVEPLALSEKPALVDAWREDGWHFYEYAIRGEQLISVVAGCRGSSVPAWNRFVLVREDIWTGEVVRSWDSAVAADLDRERRATRPAPPTLAHASSA